MKTMTMTNNNLFYGVPMAKDNLTSSFLTGFEGKKATVKKTGDLAKKNKKTKALTEKSDIPYSTPGKA